MMRNTYLLGLLLFAFIANALAGAAASSVLDLTKTADFEATVGKQKGALVEFFAPWCGHCKKLAPTYEELGDAFASKKDSIVIAKVDADANRELGQRFGVRGFPTLMWFKPNSLEPETYDGARDLKNLKKYVEEQSGKRAQVKPKVPSKAVQLDSTNFDTIVKDTNKHVFVEFYAPWCGFCKKVAPVIERVASAFENEDDCVVAQMDADNAANREFLTANNIEVSGYPTFRTYPKTKKDTPEQFQQTADMDETEAKMIEHINSHCFTHRIVGGGLSDLAGRIPLLDTLASRFYVSDSKKDERKNIVAETKSFVERVSKSANATEAKNVAAAYYIKVMDKMMVEPSYLERETKRLASLIKKHTEGTSVLAARKYDDLKRRSNILASFTKREMSAKAREAAEKITGGKDEL